MDFNLAKKHNKELEQRRREAKRKLDQQRRDEEVQKVMEEGRREREEQRMAEEQEARQRREEEAMMNDGVHFGQKLRAYPTSRADDKLLLPPSALEALERQGALDGGILTFAVALPHGPMQVSSSAYTHAGVAEFTAEEGTVGVPPRVALCLTKGAGLDSLAAVGSVEIRFVRMSRSAKSTVRFQPRGEGFHAGGQDAVRMDLEHVLLESLRGHTALTEGDWLPIRYNGITYELLVRELAPDPQILLLDTDLTVEVLPSEQTEAELRAEEERKAREEAAKREAEEQERLRVLHAQQKALSLPLEPAVGPEATQLRLALPEGSRIQRRFLHEGPLQHVLDWVESEQQTRVRTGEFLLVQKWPGHMREFGPANASQSLKELGFSRQEALFLKRAGEVEAPTMPEEGEQQAAEAKKTSGLVEYWKPAADTAVPASGSADTGAWRAAEENAHANLDKRIIGEVSPTHAAGAEVKLEDLQGEDLVAVFQRLVAFGMSPQEAAKASKKYSAQLQELGNMGFDNWPAAVQLLDKYQGRLLRVANALAEGVEVPELPPAPQAAVSPQEFVPPPAVTAPAAVPAPSPTPAAPSQPAKKAVDKEAIAAKFQELIKTGINPNEAATQAIKIVRAEAEAAEAAAAAAAPPAAPAVATSNPQEGFAEKMTELAAMGFIDEARNEALLQKYAGRMERVIEALCSA